MLLNLEILNGEMSPKFDKYVNTYTVEVKDDILTLVMDYETEEGVSVEEVNNNLVEGENLVYLRLKKDEKVETITLEVYKESSKHVFDYDKYLTDVSVEAPMPEYIPPIIIGSCFLVIAIAFLIIFHKSKNKKAK